MSERFNGSRIVSQLRRLAVACGLATASLVSFPGGVAPAMAGSGDPQLKTDHPWYPGELSCSTFDRLFKTKAEVYKRVTGRDVSTDEDKALAAWYWRNLHFAHGEEGKVDCFGAGVDKGETNRDYWTGLFAHGFALCGTTHSQWNAEMDALLGHCRSRVAGVSGHNSFEVYLTGGAYGKGQWAVLDHDISTVIFSPDGSRLLSMDEVKKDIKTLKDPNFKPDRQRGWRVSGLADSDAGGVYTAYNTAEYLSGYAGPPPIVHLRPGESLRRYLQPGLDDGKTFVFWGMNYKNGGIPGPERDRAWVNQPEKMFGSQERHRLQVRPRPLRQRRLHLHPGFRGRVQGRRRSTSRPTTSRSSSTRRTSSAPRRPTPTSGASTPPAGRTAWSCTAGPPAR